MIMQSEQYFLQVRPQAPFVGTQELSSLWSHLLHFCVKQPVFIAFLALLSWSIVETH